MVTAAQTIFDPAAEKQYTQSRIYMGGPRNRVAREIANEGHSVNLNAFATLVVDLADGAPNIVLNGGTIASFPTYGAAFAIRGPLGENWFTYSNRQSDTLYDVRRLSGVDVVIPTTLDGDPNPISLWRNVTSYLSKGRKGFQLAGSGFEWTMSLEGAQWNKLFVFQGASVMLLQRYRNSTFLEWTDWDTTFIGYADPIRAGKSNKRNNYSFTARGQNKYLEATTIPAQQFGAERIHGEYSSSPILANPDLAPEEGRIPRDFGLQNLDDDDRLTTTVFADIPSTSPPLTDPTGTISAVPRLPRRLYQKIQQVFCSGVDGPRISSQMQTWFELVNGMSLDPPNEFPWEDDTGTPWLEPDDPDYRPPVPADFGNNEWLTTRGGGHDISNIIIEAWPSGIRLYPYLSQANNILAPQQPAVFCFDQKIFEDSHRVPDGTNIVELKNLDGYAPGMWMNDARHGVGSSFSLNPNAGGLIIYDGQGPDVKDDGNARANALVTADDINTDGTITLDSVDGFSTRGEARAEGNINSTFQWTGVDTGANKLTGCFRKPGADQVIGAGTRINQSWFRNFILDAVFWGTETPPAQFWFAKNSQDNRGNGDELDSDQAQNVSTGFAQDAVWVNRDDATQAYVVSIPGRTVAPSGIPINTAIRRKRWAGGVLTRRVDDTGTWPNAFEGWDSGTAEDWELRAPPLPGNPAPLNTTAYVQIDLGEHPSAFVVQDLTDTLINVGQPGYYQQTITVGAGTAWEYPAALGDREFCTAGGVRFRYDSRDANTFYGVRKLNDSGVLVPLGDGDTIAPGSEVLHYVDLNPDWRRGENAQPQPRNLYDVACLFWNHYKILPSAVVVADTRETNGQIRAGAGQLSRWPSEGTFRIRSSHGDATINYEYTSRDSTVLYGVTLTGIEPADIVRVDGQPISIYQIPPGRAMTGGTLPNFLKTYSIYGSRRDEPGPFNVNYGSNADWETIISSAHMDYGPAMLVDILATGHAPRWRHLVLHIWETSDGKYPALSSLHAYRIPRRSSGDFQNARQLLTGGHSYGDIVNEILDQAGIYASDRKIALGGPMVRTLPVARDNAKEIILDIAQKAGYIFGESNMGKFEWFPDPRQPGAPFPEYPAIVLDTTNVFGEATIEELPYHAASQIHAVFHNLWDQEVYDITYPPQPLELGGTVREVKGRFATSHQDALFQVKNMLARANGGYRVRAPIGHTDTFRPLDLARVNIPFDVTGYSENRTYMIVGGDWEFSSNGQKGVLELQTFKKS